MIEVRIEVEAQPWAGRCWFCFDRLDPATIHGVCYEEGEPLNALACAECLALADAELREVMRETASRLVEIAEDLRTAAGGLIRRPAAGVLALERLHRLDGPNPDTTSQSGGSRS